jgi:hypothetical protein
LSFFNLYELTLFQLPGFVSERVTSRFAVVGVIGWILAGCVRLSATGVASGGWRSLPGAVMFFAADCYWSLQLTLNGAAIRPVLRDASPYTDLLKATVPDPSYLMSVWLGHAISIATAIIIAVIALRAARVDRVLARASPASRCG